MRGLGRATLSLAAHTVRQEEQPQEEAAMNVPLTPLRFLRRAADLYAGKEGVVCGDWRCSYAEFSRRAGQLGRALASLDLRAGDRVAFLSYNCHRLLEAYYGVPEAGGILLPLNIRLAPPEQEFILNDSGARFLFLDPDFLPLVESFRRRLKTAERFFLLDGERGANAWLEPRNYDQLLLPLEPLHRDIMEVDEDSVCELFYTSGSTGDPKGVMLTHRTLYLHTIPLFHANGWGGAHAFVAVGGKHVMIRRFDPAEVFRLIERERVESFAVVPAMAIALVNHPARQQHDLSSLKMIMIGGAASSPELIAQVEAKLGCTCVGGYGLTETSPVLSLALPKSTIPDWEARRAQLQAMTGHPMLGVEMRVADEAGREVPRDARTVGEILVRSDVVMEGYWNQPQETGQALAGGWFHTGDLATWDENGMFLIVDRKKEIIVSGGENVSSLEVEKVLLAHPAVYEVAVIPVPDEKWGEVPKALVSLKPGQQVSEEELMAHVRSRLAGYKVPKSVEFLAELPKSGTGKIQKRLLREQYWQHLAKRVH